MVLLLSGAAIAVGIEVHARSTGRWAYSELMPMLPVVDVGLSPVVQLLLLGGGLYILLRKIGTFDGSRREGIHSRGNRGISGAKGLSAPEIFRLAKRYDGVLTVSDVVSELGIDPKEAEALLEGLTDGQRVDMQVDDDGIVRFVFREFTP